MSLSRIAAQTATATVRKASKQAAQEGAEQAARVAGDTLAVTGARKATKAAAAKAAKAVMAPPVLTKKAAELLTGAGVTKVAASEALAAGDLVFQQAVKQGLKQTDALAMASKRIADKLGPAAASTDLVMALTNGLRPATRAKLGTAAAAGQATRTVTGATGKVKPKPPAAVTPAPTKPAKPAAPAAGTPAPARPAKPAAPAKPAPVSPTKTKPIAGKPAPAAPTKPAPVNPTKPIAGKPAPATPAKPGAAPAAIRTLAGDVALLGTAAYEAGRVTRRAADASFRAGQATRAFVDGGGVTRSWQAAWARHDQAYKAMHRELAETGEAASRWVKDLASRVIAK